MNQLLMTVFPVVIPIVLVVLFYLKFLRVPSVPQEHSLDDEFALTGTIDIQPRVVQHEIPIPIVEK